MFQFINKNLTIFGQTAKTISETLWILKGTPGKETGAGAAAGGAFGNRGRLRRRGISKRAPDILDRYRSNSPRTPDAFSVQCSSGSGSVTLRLTCPECPGRVKNFHPSPQMPAVSEGSPCRRPGACLLSGLFPEGRNEGCMPFCTSVLSEMIPLTLESSLFSGMSEGRNGGMRM